jgi:serine acetyltransferase
LVPRSPEVDGSPLVDHISYIDHQLRHLYPSPGGDGSDLELLARVREEADARFGYLASRVRLLARTGTAPDPLHVMKHPIYLYLLARVLFERDLADAHRLKDRLYGLNKALNGCSIYFRIRMPRVFFLNYATQVVLGDCGYGENLVVYQGVTVGGYRDKVPTLSDNVVLMPNCVVSGSTRIGNNVVVSAGVACVNQDIPDNTVVFGSADRRSEVSLHPLRHSDYIDYFIAPRAVSQ